MVKKKKNPKHGTSGLTAHVHTRPLSASTRDHNRVIYFPNITAKSDIVLVRFWLFQLPVAILFSFTSFHWWEIFWKTSRRSWENSLLFGGIIQHVTVTGNWSHPKCSIIEAAQCQRLYGPTKHLPKINPARYRHILCSRKSDEYFTKQNIHHRQSFMSRTWWYPCAPLGLSRVSQISLKFQLRLCAAPQWLGERSTGEEK